MSKQYSAPPTAALDSTKTYTATFDTTRGPIVVQLYASDAPKTVGNFVGLARDGFYDGLSFHRVIPNFMVQGGCPLGSGTGDAGYKFKDENFVHKHGKGSLSMANAGPNTNGSQFFITHAPQPHLNGKHTVFGQVITGQEIVDAIKQGDKINSLTISES